MHLKKNDKNMKIINLEEIKRKRAIPLPPPFFKETYIKNHMVFLKSKVPAFQQFYKKQQ